MKQLASNIELDYSLWCHSIVVRLTKLRLTRRSLARFLNIPESQLSKYLSMTVEPGLSFYFRVESFLKSLENDL